MALDGVDVEARPLIMHDVESAAAIARAALDMAVRLAGRDTGPPAPYERSPVADETPAREEGSR